MPESERASLLAFFDSASPAEADEVLQNCAQGRSDSPPLRRLSREPPREVHDPHLREALPREVPPSPPQRQPSQPRRQPSQPRRHPSPPRRQPSPPSRQPSPPRRPAPEFQYQPLSEHELSQIRTAEQFRNKSKNLHPNRHQGVLFGQDECHRIPNAFLFQLFDESDDPIVKNELLRFGMSDSNIRNQKSNDNVRHRNLERKFGLYPSSKADPNITDTDFQNQSSRMKKALERVVEDGLMSPQTRAHILNGLAKKNPTCLRFVASVGEGAFAGEDDGWDCRKVRDQESRQAIYAAREAYKRHEQEERRLHNQSRPTPKGAVAVGTHSSRGLADGSTLYQGPHGGLFTMSEAGNKTYQPRQTRIASPEPVRPPSRSSLSGLSSSHFASPMSSSGFGGFGGFGGFEPSFSPSFAPRASSAGFHVSSGSANGRELHVGPRGGVYYETASGNRQYVKRR
eukprot:Skav203758  [mRNA]  locus=scaffold68:698689:700053:+ [translate_table: standard]